MFKVWFVLAAILTPTALSEAQSTRPFTAPTFYIAASVKYGIYPTTLDVKGASNLPPGSRLTVELADFVGENSSILSEDQTAVVNKDGFFAVTLKLLKGKHFKDNMVCHISFITNFPAQDPSVLRIVGKHGELLGIENNPQVQKNSGGYYLEEDVHIP